MQCLVAGPPNVGKTVYIKKLNGNIVNHEKKIYEATLDLMIDMVDFVATTSDKTEVEFCCDFLSPGHNDPEEIQASYFSGINSVILMYDTMDEDMDNISFIQNYDHVFANTSPEIPICVLGSKYEREDEGKAFAFDIEYLLCQPFSLKILQIINNFLNNHYPPVDADTDLVCVLKQKYPNHVIKHFFMNTYLDVNILEPIKFLYENYTGEKNIEEIFAKNENKMSIRLDLLSLFSEHTKSSLSLETQNFPSLFGAAQVEEHSLMVEDNSNGGGETKSAFGIHNLANLFDPNESTSPKQNQQFNIAGEQRNYVIHNPLQSDFEIQKEFMSQLHSLKARVQCDDEHLWNILHKTIQLFFEE